VKVYWGQNYGREGGRGTGQAPSKMRKEGSSDKTPAVHENTTTRRFSRSRKRGGMRRERLCYHGFFWDEENERDCIVGSVHFDKRSSLASCQWGESYFFGGKKWGEKKRRVSLAETLGDKGRNWKFRS